MSPCHITTQLVLVCYTLVRKLWVLVLGRPFEVVEPERIILKPNGPAIRVLWYPRIIKGMHKVEAAVGAGTLDVPIVKRQSAAAAKKSGNLQGICSQYVHVYHDIPINV